MMDQDANLILSQGLPVLDELSVVNATDYIDAVQEITVTVSGERCCPFDSDEPGMVCVKQKCVL